MMSEMLKLLRRNDLGTWQNCGHPNTHALLYRLGKISYLQFLRGKTWFS